ncbi:FMN-linked alkanal monooxygenase [Actinocatenispora thailandica]|uniref:FMN-linked alkanal monooxygenase n=1 Tax=Actinocatenispora thailandica TaxID=227318 RepID=A0A7R7DWP9_9ACTN|nr:LLM class flavin-dependent oxidoreductase [Actinocatenispora thailandica]BCJ39144.1 FMN-linked alkanal monooxygenase [Actinocatenispora thailandica]
MSDEVKLSVLDLAPVPDGSTPADALRNSVELVRLAERLGYHRYWVAEHHNMPGIASSSPPVLIGHLASATERIRIGSGGVMLPNHAPLVVAEQFGMLSALHDGRIDLGLGRAPGTDQVTAHALRRDASPAADEFPRQLGELIGFLDGEFPDDHPYASITAVPGRGYRPPIWLLGSSGYSAQLAGALGMPFSFAHHFAGDNTVPAVELYRSSFRPSPDLAEPYVMLGVSVFCADTEDEARRMASSQELSFLQLRTGRPGPLPSPEQAANYPYTSLDRQLMEQRGQHTVVGDPKQVAEQLTELVARTGAQELMVTTQAWDHAARLHSYELVAGH